MHPNCFTKFSFLKTLWRFGYFLCVENMILGMKKSLCNNVSNSAFKESDPLWSKPSEQRWKKKNEENPSLLWNHLMFDARLSFCPVAGLLVHSSHSDEWSYTATLKPCPVSCVLTLLLRRSSEAARFRQAGKSKLAGIDEVWTGEEITTWWIGLYRFFLFCFKTQRRLPTLFASLLMPRGLRWPPLEKDYTHSTRVALVLLWLHSIESDERKNHKKRNWWGGGDLTRSQLYRQQQ